MDGASLSSLGFSLLFWAIVTAPIAKERNDIISDSGLEADGGNDAFAGLFGCVKTAETERPALNSGGDVVIGGIFPLHYSAFVPQQTYSNKPEPITCSG